MPRHEQGFEIELPDGCLAKTACFLSSVMVLLLSIFAASVQLFAYMNMHFGNTLHLVIFVAGWAIVLTCLWCGYSIVRSPSWQRLKRLFIAIPLLTLFFWLYSQRFASGLIH